MGLNKYQCLTPYVPPFLPVNKILLNEENEENPETMDTFLMEKKLGILYILRQQRREKHV